MVKPTTGMERTIANYSRIDYSLKKGQHTSITPKKSIQKWRNPFGLNRILQARVGGVRHISQVTLQVAQCLTKTKKSRIPLLQKMKVPAEEKLQLTTTPQETKINLL